MKSIKDLVKEKYGKIAEQNMTGCCDESSCCDSIDYTVIADDYSNLTGYNKDADLGLGCGLPTEFAGIKKGDTVVDLGSGAGNDCFIARAETGESGKVIGIDFTVQMILKAIGNTKKLGFTNVEFIQGDIEDIPLVKNTVDVVVSNCVFNLVPDKKKAFMETYRILKSGGHFSISDIVLEGNLPTGLQESVEIYAGCVAGAIQLDDYLKIVKQVGFKNITIQKKKGIQIPEEILLKYLTPIEIRSFNVAKGIYSITLFAEKPA